MSVEIGTLSTDKLLQEKPATSGEDQAESVGKADGVSYAVEVAEDSTRRAVIEYSDLIGRIRQALKTAGYNPDSRSFDVTISNWLDYHCQILPVDVIRIVSKESDWGEERGTYAPWFDTCGDIWRQCDGVTDLMAPSMPPARRAHLEIYLGKELIWK